MDNYFNLVLSDDIKRKLDERAEKLLESRKPITLQQWLGTKEGAALTKNIRGGHYNHLPIHEVNQIVKEKYSQSTGGAKLGRPKLAHARAEIIEAALNVYL